MSGNRDEPDEDDNDAGGDVTECFTNAYDDDVGEDGDDEEDGDDAHYDGDYVCEITDDMI